MPISSDELMKKEDLYIDYSFEEVMFFCDRKNDKIFKKFYGKEESPNEVHYTSKLFNDAILYGEKITKEEYLKRKEREE